MKTPRKTKPRSPSPRQMAKHRALAEKIATYLFTIGGTGNVVDRLWMVKGGEYQCGWGLEPMTQTIERIIRENA